MHLTRFTDYGLRTLVFLALAPERLALIAEVAAAYQISESHMTKVVHKLGQAGLVETLRGRKGGFRLARPAAEIGIGEVVRALEPELALVECQAGEFCTIAGVCKLQRVVEEAQAALVAVLDKYSLADVAGPHYSVLIKRLGLA